MVNAQAPSSFSILERIVGVETSSRARLRDVDCRLSVSSNGSLGLKPQHQVTLLTLVHPFSILERIVGVETRRWRAVCGRRRGLSVSSNGSLGLKRYSVPLLDLPILAFSILERIVGVETCSSPIGNCLTANFQYPRTDRWG